MKLDEAVKEVMAEFQKHLQADGGDIELVEIVDGVAKVKITRTTTPATFSTFLRDYKTRDGITCGSCRIPTSTIIAVLEAKLKEKIPSLTKVEIIK
jgi:Fe-S cluster biogenesis protein NfuA